MVHRCGSTRENRRKPYQPGCVIIFEEKSDGITEGITIKDKKIFIMKEISSKICRGDMTE